jgi:hypothetical protein
METYTLSLALVDFLPSIAFLVGGIFLFRMIRSKRGLLAGWLALAGTLLVFLGGFTKALWKLLVAARLADIQWLAQSQFVLSAIGFLALCLAVISYARQAGNSTPAGTVLAMAAWKIPFLFVMVVASLGMEGILAYLAFRRKVPWAAAGFILGVLGLLAMSVLSGAEQTIPMQWMEEVINTTGQAGFMLGCILLDRNSRTV